MKRSLTAAALAALVVVAAGGGSAFARTSGLSADDPRDCVVLELMGEGSCADKSPPSYEPPKSLTSSSEGAPVTSPRNGFSSDDSSIPTPVPVPR
jgi:hypothetical protein